MDAAKVDNYSLKDVSAEVTNMGVANTTNIYQRMLFAQTKLDSVGKNLTVGKGDNQYKAVSERDILDAVKVVEKECGIYSFPYSREVFELKETTNKYGTVNYWIRINTKYRFVNVDKPEEFIEVDTYGDGIDTLDKAPGKAMTYADKYALMKAYKISTGDDPDKDPSEGQEPKTKVPESKQVPPKEKKSEPKQDPPKKKTIEELAVEWQTCRNKLFDLDVDIRSESIKQWMADKTDYGDQEIDLTDPIKMEKLIAAYHVLIKGKEQGKKNEDSKN